MEIQVNNKLISIPSDYTLGMLLKHMDFSMSIAVFINSKQLLIREYDDYILNEKDVVSIIRPLGGG